jgi:metal-sulfur cluster biosynthetic enzyme
MEITPDEVRECLRENTWDPELEINVVDLGLIYDIDVRDHKVYIEMTLTTPGCPLIGALASSVEAAIKAMFSEETDVDVNVVWDPPWSPEMMSAEAKAQLGF